MGIYKGMRSNCWHFIHTVCMVIMTSIFAVLCLAVAVQANLPTHIEDIIKKEGEQYKLFQKYTASLELEKDEHKDVFKGLDIARKGDVIGDDDLSLFYWDKELAFAKKRFTRLYDRTKDNKISEADLELLLKETHIKVALIECSYLLSPGLQQSCYADQLLTYAALVLGPNDASQFFDALNTDKSSEISKTELDKIKLPTSGKVGKDLAILFEELGGNDQDKITKQDFLDYVVQESINDDFRVCRQHNTIEVSSGKVDFDKECLQRELVEYANDDLTELDMSVLFRAVDTNDNKFITKDEIIALDNVKFTKEKAESVMKLLDMSATTPVNTDPKIDYGEFRTYLRSPTVLVQLERDCTEPEKTQKAEIECLFKRFKDLILEGHDPIWLVVPDLDQTITFEILDKNNNGKIKGDELSNDKFSNPQTVQRFIKEADNLGDGDVCLEEFNEYVDIPHMVYGTADCLLKTRKDGTKRGACFIQEVSDVIDNFKFFEKSAWLDWFKHYNTDKDQDIDANDKLGEKLGKPELTTLFLQELGQGGESVTLFEFTWYVKQQDLADTYEKKAGITALVTNLKPEQITKLNAELVNWIQNDVTEYDVEQFFERLDVEKNGRENHELDKDDFGNLWTKVEPLIKAIDAIEPESDFDKTVNFREFWLWIQSPNTFDTSKGPKIEDIFKNACTVPKTSQKEEIDCYVKTFKEPSNFGITS